MKRLILLTLFTTLFVCNTYAGDNQPLKGIRSYEIGMAPNFKLEDIDGEPFELKQTRGKWVFLHFWASWCGPCLRAAPTLDELAEEHDGKLVVAKLNTEQHPEVSGKFQVMGLPTFFIFKNGEIIDRMAGFPHKAALKRFAEQYVPEDAPAAEDHLFGPEQCQPGSLLLRRRAPTGLRRSGPACGPEHR